LGIATVKRFPDRTTAARRIWQNLASLSPMHPSRTQPPNPRPRPSPLRMRRPRANPGGSTSHPRQRRRPAAPGPSRRPSWTSCPGPAARP
jgi:hypothetical protein